MSNKNNVKYEMNSFHYYLETKMNSKGFLFDVVGKTGYGDDFKFSTGRVDANFWRTEQELKKGCYGYSGCTGLPGSKVTTNPMKESEIVYVIKCQTLKPPDALLNVKHNLSHGPRDNYITPLSYERESKRELRIEIASESTMKSYNVTKVSSPNLTLSRFVRAVNSETISIPDGERYNKEYYVDSRHVNTLIEPPVYNVKFEILAIDVENNEDYIKTIIVGLCDCILKRQGSIPAKLDELPVTVECS